MIEVISHRGYWLDAREKNTREAFLRSFELGFGTETDLRVRDGELVISHDTPTPEAIGIDEVLELYRTSKCTGTLALNVKEDGLQKFVAEKMSSTDRYFLFDMSVPDQRIWLKNNQPTFTRMSDVEKTPVYLEHSLGIWIDTLDQDWLTVDVVTSLSQSNPSKIFCFVSPELHGRPHLEFWEMLSKLQHLNNLMLCTDLPEDATNFLKG